MKNKLLSFLLSTIVAFSSCADQSNLFYINEGKKAIIPCDGRYLKSVDIEWAKGNVTYEGVDTIYFNKPSNAVKITADYKILGNDYVLKLEPNSTYTIISRPRNGDQGPAVFELKTDKTGNIVHNINNTSCR